MQVRQILTGKTTDGIITAAPDMTVAALAELLTEKRIGAVVISSDGTTPEGIVSERDIVRRLARQGASCLGEKAADIMTPDPVTCALSDTSAAVFAKMSEGRFRHLPVVVDGKMVGIISIGDVVAAQLSELAMEKQALQGMIMGVDVGG